MFRARGRKNIEKRALNRILPLHLHLAPCMQFVQLFFPVPSLAHRDAVCLFIYLLLTPLQMLVNSFDVSKGETVRAGWVKGVNAR